MLITTAVATLATLTSVAVGHNPTTAVTLAPASVATTSNISHATYRVFNTGTADERLSVQAVDLKPLAGHAGSWAVFGEASHYKVSQAHFTLKAKASKDVLVTIYAPSDQWRHDYGVSVQALPGTTDSHGAANISASAVARFTVRPLASPAPSQKPVAVGEATPNHSSPIVPIGALAALSALLLGLGVWLRRRMRHAA